MSHFRPFALFRLVLALAGLGLAAPQAAASERAAIVIAASVQGSAKDPTALADARLMSTLLREMGFNVLLVENPDSASLTALPGLMREHLRDSKLSFVYFAGFAAPAKGDNVILAADAASGKGAGLAASELVAAAEQASAAAGIVVLDARPAPGGPLLASLGNARPNLLLVYAAAPGSAPAASDGAPNGVYATTLANALAAPGVGAHQLFRDIRRSVREATKGTQLPVVEGGNDVDVVLRRPPAAPEPALAERPGLDEVLWRYIRDSADEADFNAFARFFPNSQLKERALARQIRLASASEPGVGALTRRLTLAQAEIPALDQAADIVLGTTGDRAPPKALRLWPKALPAGEKGLGSLVKRCDELAADPDDPMRLTPGVNWSLVNVRNAMRACVLDLSNQPDDRRLQFELGRVLDISGNHQWAEYFYRQAIEHSYSAAVANRAYMSMTGRGRAVDWDDALVYLRKGADLGNPRTRTDLGVAYLRGSGVPKSTPEALLWLRLAGSHGWPNAIDVLGGMYEAGNGVEKDMAQAVDLYSAAAWTGNTNAMVNLGRATLDGRGLERNVPAAASWFERSSAGGNPFAPFFLADMYLNGAGVPKNPAKALELLALSSNRGFGQARFRLGELLEKGDGGRPDLMEAAFNYGLTDRQTFETPVSPDIIAQAKAKFDAVRRKLTAQQRDALDKRIKDWILLNG